MARLARHRKLRAPFRAAARYVLVERRAPSARRSRRARGSRRPARRHRRQSPAQAAELWALCEGIGESLAATGFPHKNDIALPIAALESSAPRPRLFLPPHPGWEICLAISATATHVNVMKPDEMEREAFLRHGALDAQLFALCAAPRQHSRRSTDRLLKKPYSLTPGRPRRSRSCARCSKRWIRWGS
jgi:hypothetical protein